MNYKPEELIPIVAELTDMFTKGESTSVTYEAAQYLMEAVLYCIREAQELFETKNSSNSAISLPATDGCIDAMTLYDTGYQAVLDKLQRTKDKYKVLISNFNSYGNRNLNDTVLKAIPGFFKYYSPRFSPQDTIITMDYPTIEPIRNKTGIDAIEEYIDKITAEQHFLASFAPGYVEVVLRNYTPDYKNHFFNLSEIVEHGLTPKNEEPYIYKHLYKVPAM